MNLNELLSDIQKLFSKGLFFELVDKYVDVVSNIKYTSDPIKQKRNIDILYNLLAACMECGYYCDYLDVLARFNQIAPLHCIGLSNKTKMIISNFALESLIYCLYNNEVEKLEIKYSIPEQIENVLHYLDKLEREGDCSQLDKRQAELQALYEDYQNQKLPIYTVEYLYPYEPIVPDYCFNLSGCYPYISLEVKRIPRDNDCFTSFKFKVYGLIKPDTFWMGPKSKAKEKMPPVRKSLDVANAILLQAVKASPGKMVIPYNISQVSTASMFQYRWDEKEHILGGTITGTDFTADWVGNNAQWHKFTDDEMVRLNEQIINIYHCKPFVTTFHHATNLFSAGFYLEAFSLLCFSCEGMTYHWLEELAEKHGILEEYIQFHDSKISKCDSCAFFNGTEKEKPNQGMKPSLFMNIGFFHEKGIISGKEKAGIMRFISKVRNDDIRNDTVHGSNSQISKTTVEQTLKYIFELQDAFQNIVNKPLKSQVK